jgi:hypothetical protein
MALANSVGILVIKALEQFSSSTLYICLDDSSTHTVYRASTAVICIEWTMHSTDAIVCSDACATRASLFRATVQYYWRTSDTYTTHMNSPAVNTQCRQLYSLCECCGEYVAYALQCCYRYSRSLIKGRRPGLTCTYILCTLHHAVRVHHTTTIQQQ